MEYMQGLLRTKHVQDFGIYNKIEHEVFSKELGDLVTHINTGIGALLNTHFTPEKTYFSGNITLTESEVLHTGDLVTKHLLLSKYNGTITSVLKPIETFIDDPHIQEMRHALSACWDTNAPVLLARTQEYMRSGCIERYQFLWSQPEKKQGITYFGHRQQGFCARWSTNEHA